MSNLAKKDGKDNEHDKSIKKLLKEKNLNPEHPDDLKYLLSLTLRPKIKKFNFEYLLLFLLKYLNQSNQPIFYEYFFQSCELGKVNNVKILLENGLSVNCQNNLGETPLHVAISKNDIELIKLLVKYEPYTNLTTDKDNLTVMNYAEIRGNKNIIKLINDLNEINIKKKIKSEIIDYINKDMNNMNNLDFSNISNLINKNDDIEQIQNYNGEIISIVANEEASNSIINSHINKNVNIKSLKKINNNKDNKDNKDNIKNTITQTIINESDFCEDISPKNTIKVNNYSNNINNINNNTNVNDENQHRFFTEECICDIKISNQFTTDLKYFTSPLKKKNELLNYYNNNSINPSIVQSLTTSHSINKEQYESPLVISKSSKSIDKKTELCKFMTEINLPIIYANYLLDNGFDDLEVLVSLSKNSIALSNQNLKDIGITVPGDRAKILIHLEEMAGNFPFILEKDIIYSNQIDENKNSLYKFLSSINLEEYILVFKENGYYNAELLYVQMISKNPITEDILKNDFGLSKIGHIKRIMLNLLNSSQNYIKRLKNLTGEDKSYKSVVFEGNPYSKACDACMVF